MEPQTTMQKITPNWAQLLIIFVFVCASQLGAFHVPVGLYWMFLRMSLCLIILITVYFNHPYIRADQTASPPESFRYGAEIHFCIHANECSEILLFPRSHIRRAPNEGMIHVDKFLCSLSETAGSSQSFSGLASPPRTLTHHISSKNK